MLYLRTKVEHLKHAHLHTPAPDYKIGLPFALLHGGVYVRVSK